MDCKKGQLSADFYIALVAFLGFLAYITFQLFQIAPASSANLKEETIRIEAYQLSELLINDGGHPNDWETKADITDIKRIGLSDTAKNIANYLSSSKVARFKAICANFNDIKKLLDIEDSESITFIEHRPTGDEITTCKSSAPIDRGTSFSVSRTVLISGTSYPTEIVVGVG